jgi:preprotein translocase subunit SecG
VFGARGSATFLTRTTGILAGLFFLLSLGMGMYLHSNGAPHTNAEDLGVMGALADKHPATGKPTQAAPVTGSEVPAAPAATNNAVPAAQPTATTALPQGQGEVPAAPATPAKH